jgi:cell division protein FtsZ
MEDEKMINLSMAEPDNMLRPRITVVGVGGAGGNAINNMIRSSLEGCDFVAANTDSQALAQSLAGRKIQLGINLSRGLGAGSRPNIGCAAAEEALPDIMSLLDGSDMLFVTAGMGGGTGTGAAPVIARAAREAGILTVGVVTKPFHFEGNNRMRMAEEGIAELQKYVDTLIVIPNQNLFRIANERTTFAEAFRMADEVLHSGVRGITDLMVMPGFMNLDFADVKTVMGEMGKAMMGTGEADGDNRAILAAEAAISNPLLDDISMKGARGVLINITGGLDMTLFEVDQAANRIRDEVDPEAQIKVGSTLGDNLDGRIRVSVIATGIDVDQSTFVGDTRGANTHSSAVKPAVRVMQQREEVRPAATVSSAKVTAPVEPVVQDEPTVSAGPTTTYFTMPTSVSPRTMTAVKASSMTTRQEEEAAPSEHKHTSSETTMGYGATAYKTSVAPLPVREIPPVQQAGRQRTATTTSTGPTSSRSSGAETASDMRITQLTATTTQAAAPSGMPINQRAQSLFQRITGFGLVRPSATQDMEDDLDLEEVGKRQSDLDIDPSDRQALSNGDSDLLDIPAFLRRQGNH